MSLAEASPRYGQESLKNAETESQSSYFEHLYGLGDVRAQQSVNDEAWSVAAGNASLANFLPELHRSVVCRLASLFRSDDLQQLHDRHWIEEVEPTEAVETLSVSRNRCNGE